MARAHSKRAKCASRNGVDVVDKADVLAGRVNVELPVSVVEVIEGVSEEVERLTAEAGLLIMKAVMDAKVESRAGPRASTTRLANDRRRTRARLFWV